MTENIQIEIKDKNEIPILISIYKDKISIILIGYRFFITRKDNTNFCKVKDYEGNTIVSFNVGLFIDEYIEKELKENNIAIPKASVRDFESAYDKIISEDEYFEYDLEEYKQIMGQAIDEIVKSDGGLKFKMPNVYYSSLSTEEYDLMIKYFSDRTHLSKAQQLLSKYIKSELGIVLRKNAHTIYQLDLSSNGYKQISVDDIIIQLSNKFGLETINDADIHQALSFISNRLEPTPNIVRFKNCIYDMQKMEIKKSVMPQFTLIETKYDYNPNAKSTLIKKFLNTSLKKDTPEETEQTIKGLKQLIGYLFTSGNNYNILPIITGKGGGGKSVLGNIITNIFGNNKVSDMKLQDLTRNTHATSTLINKHLNIINDSDDRPIISNSAIKQLTGNDDLEVNPKYKHPFKIPYTEVPKSILVCNNPPEFKKLEKALLQRFLIIEFNVQIRGTAQENPYLLNQILENKEEIEWLIYESLSEYKKMIKNNENFILRKPIETTKKLIIKHQNPVNYYLTELISDYNLNADSSVEYVYTNDLNKIIRHMAKEDGVDLDTDKDGNIPPKTLIKIIKNNFDLPKDYKTKTHAKKRYYPGLIANDTYAAIRSEIINNN